MKFRFAQTTLENTYNCVQQGTVLMSTFAKAQSNTIPIKK